MTFVQTSLIRLIRQPYAEVMIFIKANDQVVSFWRTYQRYAYYQSLRSNQILRNLASFISLTSTSPRRTFRKGIRYALVKVTSSFLLGVNSIPRVFNHSLYTLYALSNYTVISVSVQPNVRRFVSFVKPQIIIPGCRLRVSYNDMIQRMKRIGDKGDPYRTSTNIRYLSNFSPSKYNFVLKIIISNKGT